MLHYANDPFQALGSIRKTHPEQAADLWVLIRGPRALIGVI